MGIYDREYYRDENGGGAWFSGVAPATKTLILINVAVFLARWIFQDIPFGHYLTASSDDIFRRGWVWELLTAAFYHEDAIHILFNMLVLWWVGRELESIYGSREFLLMYLTAAVLGTLFWAVLDQFEGGPVAGRMLGASGAVSAAFVVYAMYYPTREILLFFIVPVPIWLAAVLFLGIDLLMLMQQLRGGGSAAGVAFAAHLGGAAYGLLYKAYDLRWSRLIRPRPFRPRLRVVRPEARDPLTPLPTTPTRSAAGGSAGPRPSAAAVSPPEQLDERLDEVLAKIAREGRAGLTEEENSILQEASRRARSRRSDRV
jgi:membrane associated rhomboid family serine protease